MNLPIWKKILFSLSVLFFIFLFLEVGSRLLPKSASAHADPFVSFSGNAPLFKEAEDPSDGSAIMKTAPYKLTLFQEQHFPKKKPKGAYRIFCMGGSTTYGRPYNDQTSFPGWLRSTLPIADPTRNWEVVNVGGVSYASYRVTALMDELAQYEPDLFIVYTGQNEFLEKRHYDDADFSEQTVQTANRILSHSSLYRFMKRSMEKATGLTNQRSRAETLLPEEVETILENSIGPASYERDDSHKRNVSEHFRVNLERMIAIAQSAGAKIAFVKPASNARNCSPFKSQAREGLTSEEHRSWQSLYDQAQAHAAASEWNAALQALALAEQIDDRQAALHYLKGTLLYQTGKYDLANESFDRSIEEDVCPLRAIDAIASAVDRIPVTSDIMKIDFDALVSNRSPQGIAGKELFIDHVHPTIEGNRLLSIQILNTLEANDIVSYAKSWKGNASLAEIKRELENELDPLFHSRALRNLARIYRWAGKYEEAYSLALQAIQHLPQDPETLYLIGANALDTGRFEEAVRNLKASISEGTRSYHATFALAEALMASGDSEQAIDRYQAALQIDPNRPECLNNLGNAYLAIDQPEEAMIAYRQAIDLDPNYAASSSNLAQALHLGGQIDAAIAQYRKSINEYPENANTLSNLGSLYLETNRLAEAQAVLEQALQRDPYLFEAVFNLAQVAIRDGRNEEAAKHLQEAIAIRPNSYDAHLELGELLLNSGKARDAIQILGQATRMESSTADAYYFAALALAQEGRFSEARHLSQQAIERQPKWAEAAGLAAELALARQSFSDAAKIEALSLALNAAELSNRKDPKILATLTRVHLLNGQTTEAQASARRAKENAERLGMTSLAEQIETQFAELLATP